MQLTTCLWFDTEAEAAANFYASVFKKASVGRITHYTESSEEVSGKKAGEVLTVEFEIEGQKFMGLNGGTNFKLNEAISFVIPCADQAEVDYYWEKLSADGGEEGPCGWLKDKFGVSWQVTPTILDDMIADPDREKADRAMAAMLEMKKINIAELEKAFNG